MTELVAPTREQCGLKASDFECHLMARLIRYRYVTGDETPETLYHAFVSAAGARGLAQRTAFTLTRWPRPLRTLAVTINLCWSCKETELRNQRGLCLTCWNCWQDYNKLPTVCQEILLGSYHTMMRMLMAFCAEDQIRIYRIFSYQSMYGQPSESIEYGILPKSYRQQLSKAHGKSLGSFLQYQENTEEVPATL